MAEWISLHEAARRYKVPKNHFSILTKRRILSSSRLGKLIMVDNQEILAYLEANKVERKKKKEIDKEDIFPEEYDENNSMDDEYNMNMLFSQSSIYNLVHAMKMVFDEMNMLIINEEKRKIFIDICLNGNIKKTAEIHGITCRKVIQIYHTSKKEVYRKIGFLKEYRKEKASLLLQIRKHELDQKNLLQEISLLKERVNENIKPEDSLQEPTALIQMIPLHIAQKLSLSLINDFNFSPRILNCLKSAEIETVEDLLLFIKGKGIDKLLSISGYGEICHNELKYKLYERGILNEANESNLLEYIR